MMKEEEAWDRCERKGVKKNDTKQNKVEERSNRIGREREKK